jgi:hypothetical protein
VLDDLLHRGLRRPEFLIVEGALGAVWRACRCNAIRFTSIATSWHTSRAPARGDHRRLQRHDLCGEARGDRRAAQGLSTPTTVELPMARRCRSQSPKRGRSDPALSRSERA